MTGLLRFIHRSTTWQFATAILGLFLLFFIGTTALHIKHVIDIEGSLIARTIEATIVRSWDQISYSEPLDRFSAFSKTTGRQEIPCASNGDGVAVLFALGQSNAANYGRTLRKGLPGLQNFNFLDGKCYKATDPLLGATGTGGSLWIELGNRLIQGGKYHHVVIVPIAVSGSSIHRWADPRDLGARIVRASEALKISGLKPTVILFIQGEADFYASPAWARLRPSSFIRLKDGDNHYSMRSNVYQQHFLSMKNLLRDKDIDAFLSIALKSRCGQVFEIAGNPVHQAQRELIRRHPDIHAGPDMDSFEAIDYQTDFCRLSDQGTMRAVNNWSKFQM
jgi:hypothetical protein